MSLPRAVVAQGERADAIIAEQLKKYSGNTEQPAPAQAAAPAAPAASPEAQKEPAAPAAPVAPAAQPPAATAPAVDWEQRAKVLQGKYNAEVPRLSAQLKAEAEARKKLEERLAALEAEKRQQPLVKPEEVEQFGEPLVDLARRIAREENRVAVDENEKLKKELEDLRAQVGQTAQVGAHLNTQAFYKALDAAHADWRAINDDPTFLTWLEAIDPLYGKPRQALLDEAQNALDADRVAAFFTAWKQDVQTRAAARPKLDEQVTPPSNAGAPVTAPQKKIWTGALITKFYDDVRRGRVTAEEAQRIELDIQAAQREGRYRAK